MMVRANLSRWIGLSLLAELIVFVAVADRIGFGWAALLSLASSLFGIAVLRRSGLSAISTLRTLNQDGLGRQSLLVDGMIGAVGAALLIVPGFLTDLVGLLLQAPSVRQHLARRLGMSPDASPAPTRRGGERIVDLGTSDWTRLDSPTQT